MTAAMAALLTVLSAAVPLLDRSGPGDGAVVHAEHPLSAHAGAHDHTICIQHSANPWLSLDAVAAVPRPAEGLMPERSACLHRVPSPYHHARKSRAPPTV